MTPTPAPSFPPSRGPRPNGFLHLQARRTMASTRRRPTHLLAVLLAAATVVGCDVKWGGGHVTLERPQAGGAAAGSTGVAAPPPVPLPTAPFAYVVRLQADGTAAAVPFAHVGSQGLQALAWPSDADAEYRARFDSAFAAPGTTLSLQISGEPAGTLIVSGTRVSVNAGCPSVVDARALVLPGQDVPRWAFAIGPAPADAVPARVPVQGLDDRTRTFGPILAENLLRQAGVDRPYLAQRADLRRVTLPGDTLAAMAATYLIGDTLAPVPPTSGSATSLFYLARFESARGYVPVWSVVHGYGSESGKRALSWLGALEAGGSRLYMLRLTDGSGEWIAAHRAGASAELAFTEEGSCPALRGVSEAPRAASPQVEGAASGG